MELIPVGFMGGGDYFTFHIKKGVHISVGKLHNAQCWIKDRGKFSFPL
jgi:hypothetical protein